jgi:hypothetical protein
LLDIATFEDVAGVVATVTLEPPDVLLGDVVLEAPPVVLDPERASAQI